MSTRGFVGYIHKGEVKGTGIDHDAGPNWFGALVLKAYLKYTQDQIKDFFLDRFRFTAHEAYCNAFEILDGLDWTRNEPCFTRDAGEYYKDAVGCEYSYIFDLDSKTKRLMVFTGFGHKPTKGFSSWYEVPDIRGADQDHEDRIYMNRKCIITGNGNFEVLKAKMWIACDKPSKYNEHFRSKFIEYINCYRAKRIDLPRYATSDYEDVRALAAARLATGG